jgi:hypothetical protein
VSRSFVLIIKTAYQYFTTAENRGQGLFAMPGLRAAISPECPCLLGLFHSSKRVVIQGVFTRACDFWHRLTLQIAEFDNE